jgi:hypothetical protein
MLASCRAEDRMCSLPKDGYQQHHGEDYSRNYPSANNRGDHSQEKRCLAPLSTNRASPSGAHAGENKRRGLRNLIT